MCEGHAYVCVRACVRVYVCVCGCVCTYTCVSIYKDYEKSYLHNIRIPVRSTAPVVGDTHTLKFVTSMSSCTAHDCYI